MEAPRFIARCRAGSIRLLSTTSIIECYIFNRDEKRREKESRGGTRVETSKFTGKIWNERIRANDIILYASNRKYKGRIRFFFPSIVSRDLNPYEGIVVPE